MSSCSDTLHFNLRAHGDSVLHKMNALREEHRFCDVTLILGSANASSGQSVHFRGHRVVLAASSDFLRDQFLLHGEQAEMSLAAVSCVTVAKTLLLSCYTGLLQVPVAELVTYLTAASVLQMSEVVDRCAQAVSQYLKPTTFSGEPARRSEETEHQQPYRNWLVSSVVDRREKDVVQPSTSIQEDKTKVGGAVLGRAMCGGSQESEVRSEHTRETVEDRKFVRPTKESSADRGLDLDTFESEEGGGNPAAALKESVFQDLAAFPPFEIRSNSAHSQPVDVAQIRQKQVEQGEKPEKNTAALQAQQEYGGELIDSKTSALSGAHPAKTAEDALEASHAVLAPRPYLCRRCDKVFQRLENYVGHLKEHRQYSCLVCGEGFSQKNKLTRHVRVHPDAKPFRCPLCHEMFLQKGSLQEHLHMHTGCKYAMDPTCKSGLRGRDRERNGQSGMIALAEGGGAS
ncbi:zinc finger and BTB domain-containing protein 26-like [Fundulus diaphanus]